jgi:hypothetical protein
MADDSKRTLHQTDSVALKTSLRSTTFGGAQGPDCLSLVLRGLKEPFFFQTEHRENGMTWLIVGTVALLVILVATPLLHGAYACRTGPFAKD